MRSRASTRSSCQCISIMSSRYMCQLRICEFLQWVQLLQCCSFHTYFHRFSGVRINEMKTSRQLLTIHYETLCLEVGHPTSRLFTCSVKMHYYHAWKVEAAAILDPSFKKLSAPSLVPTPMADWRWKSKCTISRNVNENINVNVDLYDA